MSLENIIKSYESFAKKECIKIGISQEYWKILAKGLVEIDFILKK